MNPLPRLLLFLLLALLTTAAHAAAPVVSNVRAVQRTGMKLVDIYYDLADADSATVTVAIALSGDGGASYNLPAATFTGDHGAGVTPGTNKRAVWNAGADWNGLFTSRGRARVLAEDGSGPVGMVLIPGGFFTMGGTSFSSEQPIHSVSISDFWMDRFEVTKELWDRVLTWGAANGYGIVGPAEGVAANHPVQSVSWYDVVKWCNARSAMENRTPAYYTDAAQTLIYKVGDSNLTEVMVKWTSNGYRLPTEAEWEKGARGGLVGKEYPWGSNFTGGSQANYGFSGDPYPQTTPVGYYNGSQVPAGVDMANGYGLYDMAGNVWEWCWDWYNGGYYSTAEATMANPRGPATGTVRVVRGGGWIFTDTAYLRCAYRDPNGVPSNRGNYYGFRCVLGQP